MTTAVRSRMTHRATVERRSENTTNPYGHSGPPEWTALDDALPCFLYAPKTRQQAESADVARTVAVPGYSLLAPLGSDITTDDRINGVEDRAGSVLLAGIQNIRDVKWHHDHIEIMFEGAE